jgi:hypothetical protein
MTEQLHKSYSKVIRDEDIRVVYKLIFKNAYYGLECYKEGIRGENNYCYIENLTDDEGEAEAFLKLMAKGKVFPVHIKDMAEDYFGV